MKNKTYVAIEYKNNLRYVTKVDNATKSALWQAGKAALPMNKTNAENLYFGLRCNGFKAVIVTMPDYEEPKNEEENADERNS